MPSVRTWVVLVVVAASLATAGYVEGPYQRTAPDEPRETVPDRRLVEPRDNGSHFWPYTSKRRSIDGRTLAINVVVRGDPETTRRALTERTSIEWNRTTENETDATAGAHSADAVEVTDDGVDWDDARGSTRYTYVDVDGDGEGRWLAESYQLHTGAYLGSRYHIRAYADPDGEWTAMQAHQEYWDWFRLRHTVTGVQPAGRAVESDFIDEPYVADVQRVYHGKRGGGSDGWMTVVELALTVVAVGSLRPRAGRGPARVARGTLRVPRCPRRAAAGSIERVRRDLPSPARVRGEVVAAVAEHGRRATLFLALAGLYLGVRAAGIALEGALPRVSPKIFAAFLYPVLAVGTPVLAAGIARPIDSTAAFVLSIAGLGTAIVLDFGALGVTALPVPLVLHRVALLVSLGLIAAGAAKRDAGEGRTVAALGAVGWVACLALPLFGAL
ncbi:hypothetical protein [Halegenticoccus soli]|uniref:hypothetical protein n=1 Tax=Halegenticoccus soli TaxID=1985678 RepID=UPI000C6EEA64|nr:hypothetical protein [Halegenticoccus soli]